MDLQVWFKVIWFSDWPQKRFKMYERYGLLLLTLPLAGGYDLPCSERSSLPTWFSVHSVCEDYHHLCKGNNKVHAFGLPPTAQPPTTKRQRENLWTLEVSSLREVLNVKPLVLKSFKFELSISSEVWHCFYLAVFKMHHFGWCYMEKQMRWILSKVMVTHIGMNPCQMPWKIGLSSTSALVLSQPPSFCNRLLSWRDPTLGAKTMPQ